MEKEKVLLKDLLFNEEKVCYLWNIIKANYDDFDKKSFQNDILKALPNLELKQRIIYISDMIFKYINLDYKKVVEIILSCLPAELDPLKNDWDFGDFIFSPFWEYIARYWCKKEYLELSLLALWEITKRFSVEWPIRSFFNNFENETLEQMIIWSKSDNYHLRRLSSEWSRQKLPWWEKINLDYKKTLPILLNLYSDKTRYVTRSLANHLNDLSKIDSEFVLDILSKFKNDWKQNPKELDYIIKHSLRTLVKSWNKKALSFLEIDDIKIENLKFELNKKDIKIWEYLNFNCSFNSIWEQKIVIDYIVWFLNSKWGFNKKVYKISTYNWISWEIISFSKKHLFNNFSTRKLNKWIHKIYLQINWDIVWEEEFLIK